MDEENSKFKLSNLRLKRLCESCSKPMTAHAVPFGKPVSLLVTGFCEHCQSTYVSMDGLGKDCAPAALQLAGHFLKTLSVGANMNDSSTQTDTKEKAPLSLAAG